MMKPEIGGLLHASFLIENLETSLHFYHEILGMEIDPSRPEMRFPGVWFRIGDQQIHLLQLPNPDPVTGRPAHGGRDRHVALSVMDITPLADVLNKAGIAFSMSQSGRRALFVRDPDGNALEFIESSQS